MLSIAYVVAGLRQSRAEYVQQAEDLEGGEVALDADGRDVTARELRWLHRQVARLDASIAQYEALPGAQSAA